MLYAKVVLGLPIEGPFDYAIPKALQKKAKAGKRVVVDFANRKLLGYIVRTSQSSNISNTKPILKVLDSSPILDKNMLSLTKKLSEYYCCSWGEVLETALPPALRRLALTTNLALPLSNNSNRKLGEKITLVHNWDARARWDSYICYIQEALDNKKSVIVLFSDIASLKRGQDIIAQNFSQPLAILYRKERQELNEWLKVKEGRGSIVLATRSGVFAPVRDLGLIIIDDEQDQVYKQEQVPHYHARQAALMRVKLEKAKLILGSATPSLDSLYLVKKNKIDYESGFKENPLPEIKIIDMQNISYHDRKYKVIFSKALLDAIDSALKAKGKILLFLNRKGFATFAFCHACAMPLKCPRCNINLVYHFKNNLLTCHYCSYKIEMPKICPNCNSGYIKFSGIGVEKVESELTRIFPLAKVKVIQGQGEENLEDSDIIVATSSVIKHPKYCFDLIGVLAIDNSLNRVDFRSAEKTFSQLIGLCSLTNKQIFIQSKLINHYIFKALFKKDVNIFYEEELKQRKQLKFSPYSHMVLIKLRGKNESRVESCALKLFDELNAYNKAKEIRVISVNPGQPAKLRGNFYWQVLISIDNIKKLKNFLKIPLKNFLHSGIILTVDVDPL